MEVHVFNVMLNTLHFLGLVALLDLESRFQLILLMVCTCMVEAHHQILETGTVNPALNLLRMRQPLPGLPSKL